MAVPDRGPRVKIVSLVGEIDVANADVHGDLLCRMLDLQPGLTLLVECSELDFLELRAMAMMQRVHRHAVDRGGRVHWVGIASPHRQLLELAGLTSQLVLEEAVPDLRNDDARAGADQARDCRPKAGCRRDSQKRKNPTWSSPIWWK
jgi:anti-anti-sigma regulatory factor